MPNFYVSTTKKIYIGILVDKFEYVRVRLDKIPEKFIEKYNITNDNGDGWTYFEIRDGCYGLPQSGKLANDLLRKHIAKHGYYECATTPVLWSHWWRPINFVLQVDDFIVGYVRECHTCHLQMALKENYDIIMD